MPASMPMPAKANTPESGTEAPKTMSSCGLAPALAACASTEAGKAAAAAPARPRAMRSRLLILVVMDVSLVGCRGKGSGPERPQVEGAAGAPPHLGQAERLEDQEDDDQRPEHDGAHRREHQRRVATERQRADDQLQQLGHERHEH